MPPIPPIGMIATTVEIAQRTMEIARELDMADMVSARVGYLHDGLAIAKRMVEEGVEVFITRRATTVLIEENLDIPNVTLPVTLEDLSLALSKARAATKKKHPRIGIFVMPAAQADVEAFIKHLGLDLRIYPVITDADYLSRMVDWAIADKMDVLIAGALVATYANERNLPCVLMDSGPIALRNALREARRIVHGRKLEQMRAENFQIVVNTSYHGILVLDGNQNIVVSNPAAHGILINATIETGAGFSSVLPELDLAPCFTRGEKMHNLFLSTASGALVLDATPALVDGSVRGVVVSFQPAESVTELGASTRNNLYAEGFNSKYTFDSIVGECGNIRAVKAKASGYAATAGSILLVGETGTGKELFAHAIHKASAYSEGPFIPINCAAIPASLLESELFGYEEGAFTGAMRKGKPGLFELAHQGTIFLDEISELSKHAQLRLLRVLQERNIMRLGGSRQIPIDIRVIAATNKNLRALVEEGKFRKDLFYRLGVLPLFIPPLRERREDIPLLARHFLGQGRMRGRARALLKKQHLRQLGEHDWPGNVRELKNVMERFAIACGMGDAPDMTALLEPEVEWDSLGGAVAAVSIQLSPGQQSERNAIARELQRRGGRRGEAAAALGMDRTTLYRKMRGYGM